jgi:protein-S-isoprenylcysteine O-methyltransferase Ste14
MATNSTGTAHDMTFAYLHGATMIAAWMVLGTLSLITARSRAKNQWWFPQHWIISAGTLLLSLIGLLFALRQKNVRSFVSFLSLSLTRAVGCH